MLSMLFNKKSSLEISIQAIVIVVLAMTLLGLGLGFIRGMFSDIKKTTGVVTDSVKRTIIDDLISNDRKLSFPKTDISLEKGGSEVLAVGVRNKGNSILSYTMQICPNSFNPNDGGDIVAYPDDAECTYFETAGFDKWFQFSPSTEYGLGVAADPDLRGIKLNIPSHAKSGSYFFTFKLRDQNSDMDQDGRPDLYAQQDFFVVVRG